MQISQTGIDEHRKTVHFCKAKCYQECLEAIDETNDCELYEPNFSTMLRIIANQ